MKKPDGLQGWFVGATALAGLLVAASCSAGEASGYVVEMRALSTSNAVVFSVSGDISDAAGCNRWQMFGIPVGTPNGNAAFEVVKFAFLNGLQVGVTGLGTCTTHWRSEDIKQVSVTRSPDSR